MPEHHTHPPNFAVIDLGTNTFHLLIVDKDHQIMMRKRIFVNLAEDGISFIGNAAFERGLKALLEFHQILHRYANLQLKAIGTAALRRATNAQEFVREAFEKTGIQIEVVDGDKEAAYIASGVMNALNGTLKNALIMDIGGGSVEFIVLRNGDIVFAKSYQLGVAVLFHSFHHSDPIQKNEIFRINAHLKQIFGDLISMLQSNDLNFTLVGASGTFEVLDAIFAENLKTSKYSKLGTEQFSAFLKQIMSSSLDERLAMSQIPESRAKYFIVALLLIEYILNHLGGESYYAVSSALKEGVLIEMNNF